MSQLPASGPTFVEFQLELAPGPEGLLRVEARTSDGRRARSFKAPSKLEQLTARLQLVQRAVFSARTGDADAREIVREGGTALWEELFPRPVAQLLDQVRAELSDGSAPQYRVALKVRDRLLAPLPWEFLYDPIHDDFLALQSPFVRSMAASERRPLTPTDRPLRVVGVSEKAAEPPQYLQSALPSSEIVWLSGTRATRKDVLNALSTHRPHVVHFEGTIYGDGPGDATLGLRDRPVPSGDFSRMLAQEGAAPRLVVLVADASPTGTSPSSLAAFDIASHGVPAVLAVPSGRASNAAMFPFFESLVAGDALDLAVFRARKTTAQMTRSLDWGAWIAITAMLPGEALFADHATRAGDLVGAPSPGSATEAIGAEPGAADGGEADGEPHAAEAPETVPEGSQPVASAPAAGSKTRIEEESASGAGAAADAIPPVMVRSLDDDQEPPPLIGRRAELEQLVGLLTAASGPTGEPPVVVLTGSQGSGKSVLARHAARAVRTVFPDGVRFIELRDAHPSAVEQALLTLAGDVGQQSSRQTTPSPAEAYSQSLIGKRALIVLEDAVDPSTVEWFRPPLGSALLVTAIEPLTLENAGTVALVPLRDEERLEYLREQARAGGSVLDPATEALILRSLNDPFEIAIIGELLRSFPADRVFRATAALTEHLERAVEGPDDPAELVSLVAGLEPPLREDLLALSFVPQPSITIKAANIALGDDVTPIESRLEALSTAGLLDISTPGIYRLRPDILRLAVRSIDQVTHDEEARLSEAVARVLIWVASISYESRRSGYISDMVRTGSELEDHLEMEREVDALSWVVTANDVSPPLSVGLFGVWGSGKSTFMQLMQAKIDWIARQARTARARGQEHPACGHVRQITFNAWHYADANLWASLVTHIFDELAKPTDGQEGQARREYQNLLERLDTSQTLRREAEQRRDLASRERIQRTEELSDVKHERIEAIRDVEQGRASPKVFTPTEELRQRAEDVHRRLEAAGAPLEVVPAATDDIREGIAALVADPELLRRIVHAIPDETTRKRLDTLLAEPRIRDLLQAAATGAGTRDSIVALLADPQATETAQQLIPDDATRIAVQELGVQLRQAYGSVLELRAVTTDLRNLWGKLRHLWRRGTRDTRRTLRRAAALGVLTAIVVAALFVAAVVVPAFPIATIAAAVATGGSVVATVVARIRGPLQQINEAVDIAVQAVDSKARRRIEQLEALETELQKEIDSARREEHEAEREIEDIRHGRRLQSYIEERAKASDYRSQLGIVAQVRKDFTKLAELMSQARMARDLPPPKLSDPTVPVLEEVADLPTIDRVVLYIDDLDRCPADRVVQVLEAVHLLLALPLFVVVVGVDSRWLMQSLRHHYAAQLRGAGAPAATDVEDQTYWESTPQNYLEKIFQIPFSIRGMNRAGYVRLIDEMFRPKRQAVLAHYIGPTASEDPSASTAKAPGGPDDGAPPAPIEIEHAVGGDSRESGVTSADAVASPAAVATPLATSTDEPLPNAEQPGRSATAPGPTADAGTAPPASTPPQDVDSAAGPDVSAAPPPSEATETPPEALAITDEELEFLHALAAFVPTPRAARRLANTYRLVRVLLTPAEYVGFSTSSAEYKVALTLLAMLVGFPEQATTVFRELIVSDLEDWDSFKKQVIDTAGVSRALAETPNAQPADTDNVRPWDTEEGQDDRESGQVPGAASRRDHARFVRAEAWERLSDALGRLDAAMTLPTDLVAYRAWAREVSRYSFHTGGLASAAADEARVAVESGSPPDRITPVSRPADE